MQFNIEENTICLRLPKDTFSKFNLTKYNEKQLCDIISTGIFIMNKGDQKKLALSNNEYNKKLEQIEETYKNKEIMFKKKITEKENIIYEMRNDFIKEKREHAEIIKNKLINEYEDTVINLKQSKTELENKLKNQTDKWLDKLNKERNNWIDKNNEQRNKYQERIEKLYREHKEDITNVRANYENKLEKCYEQLSDARKIQENSSLKGKKGEQMMFSTLNMLFPKCEIVDTHKEAKRGDFIINKNDKKLLIDNKDYSKNIPKCEIEKFKRDMIENKDVHAGILLSNKSGIARKEDFKIEVIDNKPIIYLHKTNQDINKIKIAVQLLFSLVENQQIDFKNKQIVDTIKCLSVDIQKKINKTKRDIDKFAKNMLSNILDVETIVNKIILSIGVTK